MPNLKAVDRREPIKNFYCVVCGASIAPERIVRKAVTCTAQHAKILKLERRRLRDQARCRMCNRPSTPEERKAFAAWRKTLGIKPGPKPQPKPPKTEGLKRGRKPRPKPLPEVNSSDA